MKNTIINEVAQLAGKDYNAKVRALEANGCKVTFVKVKNITYCTIAQCGHVDTGFSICDPVDEFNEDIGRAIALYRAAKLQVPAAYTRDAHVYKEEEADEECRSCPNYSSCFGTVEDPIARRKRIIALAQNDYENRVSTIIAGGGSIRTHRVESNVYVTVTRKGRQLTGVSQCSPRDEFDLKLGLAIALHRALELPVPTDYVTCGVRKVEKLKVFCPSCGKEAKNCVCKTANPIYDGRCTDCGRDAGTCVHTADCADSDVTAIINEFEGDVVFMAEAFVKLRRAVNALKC